jgi:LVIVD repeat
MSRWRWMPVVVALIVVGLPTAAVAGHDEDVHSDNMSLVANFDDEGNYSEGSDLAFWGHTAILGNYNGLRVMGISDPSNPTEVGQLDCPGPQGDVSVWRKLVFMSVDSPRAGTECGAGAGSAWEGIRIVSIADTANPVQIATVATDCGSHTHTLVPDVDYVDPDTGKRDPRVLIYVLSYPLGAPTATCNLASHRKISVVAVPLRRPTEAAVVSTPDVSPAIGCHDVTVFPEFDLAGAACITESQIWDMSDPVNPTVIAHIANPAIEIHHSTAFSWDGNTLVIGDEMGGAAAAPGCETPEQEPVGALWFYDVSVPTAPVEKGFFQIPQVQEGTPCTAHNFNVVPLESGRDILVSAWYLGGTTVVDFTDPSRPAQLGYYIPKVDGEAVAWSSYWYNGLIYVNNFTTESRGFDVLSIDHPDLADALRLRRLNPQTQEPLPV